MRGHQKGPFHFRDVCYDCVGGEPMATPTRECRALAASLNVSGGHVKPNIGRTLVHICLKVSLLQPLQGCRMVPEDAAKPSLHRSSVPWTWS